MNKNTKKLILIITPIILIILLSIFFIYRYLHSATIIIQVAPTSADISIDGKSVENGIIKTAPKNNVEVKISAPGFETKTLTMNLEGKHVSQLITYLTPENNDWEYYEKSINRSSLSILLANMGYNILNMSKYGDNVTNDRDSSADNLIKKLSIKSIIPINFSICGEPATRENCDSITINYEYSSKCSDELCLAISGRKSKLNQETLNTIRTKLAESGYNLDNYKYFYTQNDR